MDFSVKFGDADKGKVEDQLLNNIDENVMMKALDGFLIILSTDGDVIYVSENIHEYIGIQQVCDRHRIDIVCLEILRKFNLCHVFNCFCLFRLKSLEIQSGTTRINVTTLNCAII